MFNYFLFKIYKSILVIIDLDSIFRLKPFFYCKIITPNLFLINNIIFYTFIQKAKASIEKAEQIFLRQHLLNSKKYKLSAEEDTEEKLRKIHLQR